MSFGTIAAVEAFTTYSSLPEGGTDAAEERSSAKGKEYPGHNNEKDGFTYSDFLSPLSLEVTGLPIFGMWSGYYGFGSNANAIIPDNFRHPELVPGHYSETYPTNETVFDEVIPVSGIDVGLRMVLFSLVGFGYKVNIPIEHRLPTPFHDHDYPYSEWQHLWGKGGFGEFGFGGELSADQSLGFFEALVFSPPIPVKKSSPTGLALQAFYIYSWGNNTDIKYRSGYNAYETHFYVEEGTIFKKVDDFKVGTAKIRGHRAGLQLKALVDDEKKAWYVNIALYGFLNSIDFEPTEKGEGFRFDRSSIGGFGTSIDVGFDPIRRFLLPF